MNSRYSNTACTIVRLAIVLNMYSNKALKEYFTGFIPDIRECGSYKTGRKKTNKI